jgi:hypothetical protein
MLRRGSAGPHLAPILEPAIGPAGESHGSSWQVRRSAAVCAGQTGVSSPGPEYGARLAEWPTPFGQTPSAIRPMVRLGNVRWTLTLTASRRFLQRVTPWHPMIAAGKVCPTILACCMILCGDDIVSQHSSRQTTLSLCALAQARKRSRMIRNSLGGRWP